MVSGDNCSVIESKFGITMTQFTTWNPEINSDCTSSIIRPVVAVWLTPFFHRYQSSTWG